MNSEGYSWDSAKTEYSEAVKRQIHFTSMRRQGIAFVTAFQGAVLSVIKNDLLKMDMAYFLLSAIAFFVLLLGLNNECRLYIQMKAIVRRLKGIESKFGMRIYRLSTRVGRRSKFVLSNHTFFMLYYLIFIIVWIVIWVRNF